MPHDQQPPSRAWREGDDPGRRQFADLGDLALDSGARLPGVRLAYETWGTLSPARDNAVLVLHALTGDSHVTGPAGPGHPTPGWWDGLIGPGAALDTDRWFVVAPNVLGGCQGSTGPSTPAPDGRPWGSRFPFVTTRDQVRAETALADAPRHRDLPARAGRVDGRDEGAGVGRRGARPGRAADGAGLHCGGLGDQIAWCAAQLDAIRSDPAFRGGDYHDAATAPARSPASAVARQIAHATYRSAAELDLRFGRAGQAGDRPRGRGRPVRGGVLPRSPRRQAGPPVRRRLVRGAHRGDELPRRRPRPGRDGGRARTGDGADRGRGRSTPTGSTPCASPTRSPPASPGCDGAR